MTYKLVDIGLSSFLCLKTLKHGTGPLGFIGIHLNGANPNFGGSAIGSSISMDSVYLIRNSKQYFYVFKDLEKFKFSVTTSFLAKEHAIRSGIFNFGYKKGITDTSNVAKGVFGGIAGLFTPTLNFRFRPEDTENNITSSRTSNCFENDPLYSDLAYRTRQTISPLHLGIKGSLSQGLDPNLFNRMKNNPQKVIRGIILLGMSFLLGRCTYKHLQKEDPTKSFFQQKSSFSPEPNQVITVLNPLFKGQTKVDSLLPHQKLSFCQETKKKVINSLDSLSFPTILKTILAAYLIFAIPAIITVIDQA